MLFLRLVVILFLLCVFIAFGPMIFPLAIIGGLVLLFYGIGKASRWGWR